ncbi:hypothetical protein WOLCODRAFT_154813 [Wolfiporia cocos MD-104 SS10]|uniref:E3 ubiquitin-protein ligase listerin n=1 Tax=Wolfiporia cocos (strain MD-104) TaxID=742152 RepID=A0A2H3JRJ9_WOLCO|nr:hypothetical protein WOLCODRAFT_154813 [Wolfiporia cocos MD-104 SS10]
MAKGKSSASSATRKKHARKAAAAHGELAADPAVPKEKKAKGKDKRSKNEPRKKVYIPPVKPAPVRLDPLDTLGLAQTLPPELTVVLRRLAKKDGVTKRRALEELVTWINRAGAEGENEAREVLAEMVPVWLHHPPFLLLHPTRGIRQLAAALHSSLLTIPYTSARLLSYISSELEYDQQDYVLGTWLLATYDVDRQTAARARETWTAHTAFLVPNNTNASSTGSIPRADKLTLDRATLTRLWSFSFSSTQPVEPPSSRSQPRKGPPQQRKGAAPTPPRKGPLARMAEEDARRSPSPGALAEHGNVGGEGEAEKEREDTPDAALAPLADPLLWTILHPVQHPPFSPSADGFGHDQPGVRSAAWSLLHTLLKTCKGRIAADARLLRTLSRAVLHSAWVELDVCRVRQWRDAGDAESDEEEDEEDESDEEGGRQQSQAAEPRGEQRRLVRSTAWREFMDFLALGCGGAPVQGYPAVLVVLSTAPDLILFTPGDQSSSSSIPCEELLVNLWAALDGCALSGVDRKATNKAFVEALRDSTVRLSGEYPASSTGASEAANEKMVKNRGPVFIMATNFVLSFGGPLAVSVFLIVLSAAGKDHLNTVWRVAFGIGIMLPLPVFYFRMRMLSPKLYRESAIKSDAFRTGSLSSDIGDRLLGPAAHEVQQMVDPATRVTFPNGVFSGTIISSVIEDGSIRSTAEWQLLLGAIALPGVFVGALVCNRLGRRNTMILGFSGYLVFGLIIGCAYEKIIPLFVILRGSRHTGIHPNLGKKWTFIIAAICGVVDVLVTYFFVPDMTGQDVAEEDERFMRYLAENESTGEVGKDGELRLAGDR